MDGVQYQCRPRIRDVKLSGEMNILYPGVLVDLDRRREELGGETDLVYPSVLADLDRRT
jgi:hypothetical protein